MRRALWYFLLSGMTWALASVSTPLMAQERCGTVAYTRSLHANPVLHKIEFEKWIAEKSLHKKNQRQSRQEVQPYQIPVVFHIVHNGEPVGVGSNIPDAQIFSQLRVLNEDFRRENADAGNTPAQFLGVAGSLDIEFILAKQDRDGLATNGIVRVNGGKSSWTDNDNYTLKNLSYWPAEQYMNIWVCNLTGHLGYAQFPESDLEGMENSSTNRLTDGVVVAHKAFGSIDDGAFSLDPDFNKGRTATHEIGHWLGLNHIWGDDVGCSGTDYVSDTPNQARDTNGCPAHPRTDACGEVIMFQNFLDYSDDDCMNLFTAGQVDRMVTVIENSPRRTTLLTSPGLQDPDPIANDMGIRSIVFPDASVCSNNVAPVIELRNYGNNVVTTARIRFFLNGTLAQTKDFALNINPLQTTSVTFDALTIPSGSHVVQFQIVLTNGVADGGTHNNEVFSTVIVPDFTTAPFAVNFNTPPPGWITYNPDGQITWQIVNAPNELPVNKALKLNYFDYEDKIGEVDIFYSPVIDLTSAPAATLTFDVAHARYQMSNDRLQVIALVNCQPYTEGTMLYNKAGDALKTTPSTTSPFTPSNETQWRRELINLSAFIGLDNVQLAFVGINDWGNNIYLDNVALFTEATRDVALVRLASPSPVICEEQVTPKFMIQNAGSLLLTEVTVEYSVNNAPLRTVTIEGLDVSFGSEYEIEIPAVQLAEGTNTLFVNLKYPDGPPDIDTGNNALEFVIVVNKSADRIPLRENFDDEFTPAWTIVNTTGGMNWETIKTNYGQSLFFNAFDNDLPGDEAWLVSPVLDFSKQNQASLMFDISHVARDEAQETLSIFASKDCGVTYEPVSFTMPQPKSSAEEWFPSAPEEWDRNISVNLNSLAGEADVRIAFVIRNQYGNNFYLDNIQFFTTADPDPVEIAGLYSVYGYDLTQPQSSELKIKFNLPERQSVRYSVISSTGQFEIDGILADVLNQTFPLNLNSRLPPGIYFIRVQIGSRFHTTKVLVF